MARCATENKFLGAMPGARCSEQGREVHVLHELFQRELPIALMTSPGTTCLLRSGAMCTALLSRTWSLNIDVSRIHTYVINGRNVVCLRPMNRSKQFRPQAGTPRCLTCDCWLRNVPHLFCSLTCKEKVDVSQDDFPGPEAESFAIGATRIC
ncbi:hypothetical protein U9M48_040356 [Paspalum notatum var. saurae]|uniref:Uncharacterized protein n=1 Tax=Paspalum notatum var. saurae TaxID=547442 RepID=A0AAQ3ULK1_PASNO